MIAITSTPNTQFRYRVNILLLGLPATLSLGITFTLIFLAPDIEAATLVEIGKYMHVLFAYLLFFILIRQEKNLAEFNIDGLSIFTLIVFSFYRRWFGNDWDQYFVIPIAFCGVLLFLYFIKNRPAFGSVNITTVLIGFIWAGHLPFILVLSKLLRNQLPSIQNNIASLALLPIMREAIYQLSYVTLFEEFIFRAFLVGYLIKLGVQEKFAFLTQGIIFWLLHVGSILILNDPIAFFISIPILTFATSYLTMKYKSIFPAIIVHTLWNVIVKTMS